MERLKRLSFVADAGDLVAKRDEAEVWFSQIMGEVNDGPLTEDIVRAAARTGEETSDA